MHDSIRQISQKYTNSLERDENFVPYTRERMKLPPKEVAARSDYEEILGEAPLFILIRLVLMQTLGWPSYLLFNTMGAEAYPPGTNVSVDHGLIWRYLKFLNRRDQHFSPWSPLFKPKERVLIAISDVGILAMSVVLYKWTQVVGLANFMKLYLIPWLVSTGKGDVI